MRLIEVRAQHNMDMNFCHPWTVNDFKAFLSFHSHSRFSNAVLASLESKSYWRMSKNKKEYYKKKDQKSSPLEKWRWKRYTKERWTVHTARAVTWHPVTTLQNQKIIHYSQYPTHNSLPVYNTKKKKLSNKFTLENHRTVHDDDYDLVCPKRVW